MRERAGSAAAAAARCRNRRRGSFMRPFLPNTSTRRSFRLDVRRLDDRPPFFDLGVVKGGEPLRGLLLARSNIEAEISKAPAHGRIGESLHHGAVELADDVFRRALGCEEAEPARHVEARYAAPGA